MASFLRRFWSKVRVAGSEECWLWQASTDKDGYGQIGSGGRGGRKLKAHRASFAIHYGMEPRGVLMHTCDTPACVNPKHLEVGTQAQNVQDMVNKGRSCRGSRHHMATITEYQAAQIRYLGNLGACHGELSRSFALSGSCISEIISGSSWTHLPRDLVVT